MADLLKMLQTLRSERDGLDEAILSIERLARGGKKRRGRPPKWMQSPTAIDTPPARKRKAFSAATRKQMSESQKARWAKRA